MGSAMATTLAGSDPAEASVDQPARSGRRRGAAAQGFGLLGGLAFAPRLGRAAACTRGRTDAIADAAGRIELLIGYTKDDAAPFVAMDPRQLKANRVPVSAASRPGGSATITKQVFAAWPNAWPRPGAPTAAGRAPIASTGHRSTLRWAACHRMELPFLLGTHADLGGCLDTLGAQRAIDSQLSAEMRTRWTQARPTRRRIAARAGTRGSAEPEQTSLV